MLDGQVKAGILDSVDGNLSDSHKSNSSTLSPGKPQAFPTPNSVNGNRDPPTLPPAPPPSRPPSTPPSRLADAPMAVVSSPSATSFLGMQARELFHSKGEGRCKEGVEPAAPPPRLGGQSQGPKTELGPAPRAKGSALHSRGHAQATPTREAHAQPRARGRPGGGARGRGGGGGGGAGHVQQRQPQRRLRIMDYNETHHHEHS